MTAKLTPKAVRKWAQPKVGGEVGWMVVKSGSRDGSKVAGFPTLTAGIGGSNLGAIVDLGGPKLALGVEAQKLEKTWEQRSTLSKEKSDILAMLIAHEENLVSSSVSFRTRPSL